jgi:hypothetical protein
MKFRITGTSPLLLHNGQTSDPLNEWSKKLKKVTSKRNKTDEDHAEIGRIEFFAGLYSENGRIVIPADVIDACLLNGAKRFKLGQKYQSGCYVKEVAPLVFDGDKLPFDKLYERGQNALRVAVRVGQAKTMRTRPMFNEWSMTFDVEYFEDTLDGDQVELIVKTAGEQIGVGDWRPRYGRFKVEMVK